MLLPLVGDDDIKMRIWEGEMRCEAIATIQLYYVAAEHRRLVLTSVFHHGMLEGVQLVLYPRDSGLTLYFDDENVTDKFFSGRVRLFRILYSLLGRAGCTTQRVHSYVSTQA
jgi:hypothetical protein